MPLFHKDIFVSSTSALIRKSHFDLLIALSLDSVIHSLEIFHKLDWISCPKSVFWKPATCRNVRVWGNHNSVLTI